MAVPRFVNLVKKFVGADYAALQDWFRRECALDVDKFNTLFERIELEGVLTTDLDGRVRLVR